MGKPSTAHSPEEQFALERKRFKQRTRHKPVLGEKLIKSKEVKVIEETHDRRDYE
jgi:hypothetical protein